MLRTTIAAVICAALLSGCGSSAAPGNESGHRGAKTPKPRPIDGYGEFKFGSSFNEAMTANGARFDPYYVRDCYKDLPIAGCALQTERDGAPFQMIEGIPYRLVLEFNKHDKLTDVQLVYDREKEITGAECRSIHERTLDWLTKDYGRFYSPTYDPTAKPFRSPGGNSYLSGVPGKDGNWVTEFLRTYEGTPTPAVLKQAVSKWDDRPSAMLFSQFILGRCQVDVTFSDRNSVERRDIDRALSLLSNSMDDSSSDESTESSGASEGIEDDSYDMHDAGE